MDNGHSCVGLSDFAAELESWRASAKALRTIIERCSLCRSFARAKELLQYSGESPAASSSVARLIRRSLKRSGDRKELESSTAESEILGSDSELTTRL